LKQPPIAQGARSMRTISEFSRARSNTIDWPSGVMSNLLIAERSLSWVSRRVRIDETQQPEVL